MPLGWVAGATLASGVIGAGASMYGASQAADAAKDAAGLQDARYRQTRGDLQGYFQPGYNALNDAYALSRQGPTGGGPDYLGQAYSNLPGRMTQAELEQTPGYQFDLSQGLKAVQSAAAARGLGVSGASLKGAGNFATGLANKTYLDQFNIRQKGFEDLLNLNTGQQTNLTNQFDRYNKIATLGANAAAGLGTQGVSLANQAGNYINQGGLAEAAGTRGVANALTGAANNYMAYDAYTRNVGTGGYDRSGAMDTARQKFLADSTPMSDTLNALLQANKSSSVLEGIANPPQFNPLAAIGSANQAASATYALREKQAQAAWGDALQQATDANGNVDLPRARAIAAKDPYALQGMMAGVKDTTALQTTQTGNINAQMGLMGRGALSLSVDPSDQNLEKVRQDYLAAGVPAPQVQAFYDRLKGMKEYERQQFAHRTAATSLEHFTGTAGVRATGGEFVPELFRGPNAPGYGPPVPTLTQGGPGIAATATPSQQGEFVEIDVPIGEDGKPLAPGSSGNVIRWDKMRVRNSGIPGLPMPGAPGTAPVYTPGAGTPGAPPAATPGPTLPVNPNAPGARPRPDYTVPANAAPAGNPALVPKPAVGAPASTAPASPAPASPVVTPLPGGTPAIRSTPPQGQPEELKQNQEAYRADQAAVPNVRTRAENAGHAYDALQVLKLNTGRGAEGISNVRSFLRTVGMLPPGTVKDTDVMDIFNKYTERAMIEAAGGGGTDLARQMATQASPGKTLGTGANLEILRNDMGKTLQTMAANNTHDPTLKGSGYLEHRKNIALTTDPRGFVWNMYDEDEQKKILASVKDDPVADSKLQRAIGMSIDPKLGLSVPVSRRPQKQSFLAPPMMPPGPQANALLA